MIVTCKRESCGRMFSDISEAQLDEVIDEEGGWTCPRCGFKFDPFAEVSEGAAAVPTDPALTGFLDRAARK